ncbi:hypothetical protein PPTG_06634 [Phytophthora nicotianae INRA-310]|uniref:DDE Tnp4 domain-containing protein n=1 Tax=Phytophthora nicotianae (strain INRA-310) TaxID=761204 RepID=W2QQJ0_PHYN3|nr:hypothetical protein PPTG_06634 [Phytophthora nicotianae INRA-310]ETN15358.1 hypothetical protein PPTG_06634 [Phytophthora nicotianae INRA-310]
MSRIQEEVVQDVLLLVRELTSGLRRRYKTANLYGIWKKALLENNTTLAAAIYSYLSAESPPEVTRRVPLNSNALSNNHCIERFRFDKLQIVDLVTRFLIEGIRTRERTAATGVEGFCIVLYKLAVPIRWVDLDDFFGRDSSGLSNIFLHMLAILDDKFSRLLHFKHKYGAENLQAYVDAVFDAGGDLQNVWAFIDGTVRGIRRPLPRLIKRDGKFMSQKADSTGISGNMLLSIKR